MTTKTPRAVLISTFFLSTSSFWVLSGSDNCTHVSLSYCFVLLYSCRFVVFNHYHFILRTCCLMPSGVIRLTCVSKLLLLCLVISWHISVTLCLDCATIHFTTFVLGCSWRHKYNSQVHMLFWSPCSTSLSIIKSQNLVSATPSGIYMFANSHFNWP